MTYSEEAYKDADLVIFSAKHFGHDYSAGREEIARIFDEDLWNGNYDSSTDFETAGIDLPEIRFIQEDEYDQSMDEEDLPETEPNFYAAGHYVFL